MSKRRVRDFPFMMMLLASLVVFSPAAPAAKDGSGSAAALSVTVMKVRARTVQDWRRATGVLKALTMPRVAAEVAGRIVAVHAREGQRVRKGQPLATIDDTDYRLAVRRAESLVAQAEAQLRGARLKLERLRKLVRRGSAPQSALDAAQAAHDALMARLKGAREGLEQARRSLSKTVIRSPIDGVVQSRNVSPGDFIGTGRLAFVLVDLSRLRARLPYAETLAPLLKPGLPVKLRWPAEPPVEIDEKVLAVLPAADPASHALTVLVDIDDAEAKGLRPGGSITARVLVAAHENAVVVPATAVVLRPRGYVVYVLDGAKVRERPVKVGLKIDGMVEIRAGLKAGETIVVDGAGFLRDGMRVKVRNAGSERT